MKKPGKFTVHVHMAPRAISDNVPGDEAKQDRLRRRRERDRLRRERETPEEKDTRFVNPSRTCLPHFSLTKAK